MNVDFNLLINQFISGGIKTISLFVLTLIISLPLGLLVLYGKKSKIKIVRWIINIFISIMRGTPLMLQLMFVYYGPYYILGLPSPDKFLAAVVAFGVNYAAYFAEIYRGGLESIDNGQYEAAKVLGYSKSQTFLIIILPQVIKRILPSITNEVITLVKDTSLAMVIGVQEIFMTSKSLSSKWVSITPYIAVGGFYYVMNYMVSALMQWLEKKLNYYR